METDQTHHLRLRDRELTHIASSIASLGDLFKDLSILVIDQGTLLDSIEYNIEQTSVQVSEAVKELDIATRYASLQQSNWLSHDHPFGQVSEEHWAPEDHLPLASYHFWLDYHLNL